MTLPVTAIIVSYNSADLLPLCIDALWRHLAPEQLLVVDNASSDASAAVAAEHGAEVIVSRVNRGFGAGCNLGARSARNDVLLFVNPDVCVTSVDPVKLHERTARRPLGLLAPRELLTDDAVSHEPSVRKIVPWPCSVAREALGPVLPREISSRLHTFRGNPGRRSWVSGALLFSARTEFLELGGFDERLFLYYEDQELSGRCVERGLPLSFTDAVTGRHIRGGSSGTNEPLRAVSRAASAMSCIELIGITHGPRVARRAWALYEGLRRCATVVVGLATKSPLSVRGERKREELRSTQSAVTTLLVRAGPHYPLVKLLARGAQDGQRRMVSVV